MSDTAKVKTKIIDGYSVGDILVYMISKKLPNETRFRISMKTLRALAGLPSMRIQGTKKFLEELQDTMLEYGWSIVELNGEHFGVVRVDKTDGCKRELGDDDLLIFAEGTEFDQPAKHNGDDLNEEFLK